MSEFKTIETQEELDGIVEARLKRLKEQYADYEDIKKSKQGLETQINELQQAIESSKTSSEEYQKQISDLTAKVGDYETSNLRTQIGLQHGLPLDLVDRLKGDDAESLKADAERLAGIVKPTIQTPPPLKTTEPVVNGEDTGLKNMLKNMSDKGE